MRLRAGTTAAPAARRLRVTQPFEMKTLGVGLRWRGASSSTSNLVDQDAMIRRDVLSNTVSDYQLKLNRVGGAGNELVEWASSNPAIATVSTDGFVSHVADGVVTITASAKGQSIGVALTMSTSPGPTVDVLTDFVSGSLAKHCSQAIDSRLAGKTASNATKAFFSQMDHAGQVYTRNENCWAADIDTTCVSVWNSVGGTQRAGTLITPRHIVFAKHFPITAGSTVRFIKMDGAVVNRTIASTAVSTSPWLLYPDFIVGKLDSDVPAGISFASILPASWRSYFPHMDMPSSLSMLNYSFPIPTLYCDQEKKALTSDWFQSRNTLYPAPESAEIAGTIQSGFFTHEVSGKQKRSEFYEEAIGGDSGSPCFLIINGSPVLLTTWTFGPNGSGTSIAFEKNSVNALLTQLGGGYQLTEASLAGFASY